MDDWTVHYGDLDRTGASWKMTGYVAITTLMLG